MKTGYAIGGGVSLVAIGVGAAIALHDPSPAACSRFGEAHDTACKTTSDEAEEACRDDYETLSKQYDESCTDAYEGLLECMGKLGCEDQKAYFQQLEQHQKLEDAIDAELLKHCAPQQSLFDDKCGT